MIFFLVIPKAIKASAPKIKSPNPAACVSRSMIQLRNHTTEKSTRNEVRMTPNQESQESLIWFLFIQPVIPHKMKTIMAPRQNVIRPIVSILIPEGCVRPSVIDIPESKEFIHFSH